MSVINQMLRDLDARGQGDAASRRAAMASVGQPVARHDAPWRSAKAGWIAAALAVALAAGAVLLLGGRWADIDGAPGQDPIAETLAPPPVPSVAAPAPASPPEPEPQVEAVTRRPDPAALQPKPEPAMRAPVDPAPVLPTPPDPPPPAAPAPRATIERVPPVADVLETARLTLADGRAEAALAALAVQPGGGAERDALEAAALQQLGRHAEAEAAYRRALRSEPDIGAWWAGLGISLDASGRGEEALAAFREAQRRGPLDPALADYLGERVEALSAGEPSR